MVCCYLDVVYSNIWEDYLRHLQQTLETIHATGLSLNVVKCEWAQQKSSYLVESLGNGKLKSKVDKVEAIRCSSQPRTKKEVRSFLSLAGPVTTIYPRLRHQSYINNQFVGQDRKESSYVDQRL